MRAGNSYEESLLVWAGWCEIQYGTSLWAVAWACKPQEKWLTEQSFEGPSEFGVQLGGRAPREVEVQISGREKDLVPHWELSVTALLICIFLLSLLSSVQSIFGASQILTESPHKVICGWVVILTRWTAVSHQQGQRCVGVAAVIRIKKACRQCLLAHCCYTMQILRNPGIHPSGFEPERRMHEACPQWCGELVQFGHLSQDDVQSTISSRFQPLFLWFLGLGSEFWISVLNKCFWQAWKFQNLKKRSV